MGKSKKRPAAANPEPDTEPDTDPKKKKKQGGPASSDGGGANGSATSSSTGGLGARRFAFCNGCQQRFRIVGDVLDPEEIVYMSCPRCE
eukprot:12421207-Karenia_brevis.AAC.1